MPDKLLIIDDDTNLLASLTRTLRSHFAIDTAQSGNEGLKRIQAGAQYAIVICDMRMPGMDGIEVLKRVRELAPDSVRMMLTGNADHLTAAMAVNEGNIFRFFTKPCPGEILIQGIEAGLRQYHLVTAERDLMERTLAGSIKVLVDVLSMSNPDAYGRADKVRDWVRTLAPRLKLRQRWVLELAALLSPIGLAAIPPEVMAKYRDGRSLDSSEQALIEHAPEMARNLIANIPRMQDVGELVFLQDRGYDGSGFPPDGPSGDNIPLEARLLTILNDLSMHCPDGAPRKSSFEQLRRQDNRYDPALLAWVRSILETKDETPAVVQKMRMLPASKLRPGMVLLKDVFSKSGAVVLSAGTELTQPHIERLHILQRTQSVNEAITVAEPLSPNISPVEEKDFS